MNVVYLQVSPLAVPTARVTVSGVPPFIPNEALEQELQRFGKMASGFRNVALGCKSDELKHVQSFRRQVFMFLNCPAQTLDVSFRVKHGEGHYLVYASTGSMKCYECGDVGHKRTACPHRQAEGRPEPGPSGPAKERTHTGAPPDEEPAETTAPRGGGAPPAETEAGQGHSGQVDSQAEEQRGELGREEGQVAEEEPAAGVEDVGGGGSGERAGSRI